MVGHEPLKLSIGVRIPIPEPRESVYPYGRHFLFVAGMKGSERERGRENILFSRKRKAGSRQPSRWNPPAGGRRFPKSSNPPQRFPIPTPEPFELVPE